MRKYLLALFLLVGFSSAGSCATIYLQKINPRTGQFDYYASSPVAANTVTPTGIQATNSPSSGQVPSKAAGGDYFTWVSAGAGSGVAAGDTTTWTGQNTFSNFTLNKGSVSVSAAGGVGVTYGVTAGTITTTDTSATSLTVGGGITAGTGAVGIVNTSGQIPAISSTYFASLSGANITSISGSNVSGGTFGAVNGSALTALNATSLGSGTVPNARIDNSSVTLQANTFNGASQLVQMNSSTQLPAVSGVNLTNLNASNLASGTVPIARLNSGADDWYDDSARTWTGLGASSFTINADMTGILNPGDALKWTQSATTKYAYVYSVAFSAAVSTVTIFTSTDYTLTAAAMTAPFYSKSVRAAGFPHVFNSTATYTGFSVMPIPSTYRYWVDGHQIYINIYCTTNGTSNATTLTIAGPVTSKNVTAGASGLNEWAGTAGVVNNSALASTFGAWSVTANSTTINFYTSPAGAAWTGSGTKCAQVMPIVYEY